MKTQIQDEMHMISQKINETVDAEKVYLFGSYAYGTPTEDSDYDLCVVIPNGITRPVDVAAKLHHSLHTICSTPLDIIVCRSDRFRERQKGPTLERRIVREGVLLYERPELEQRMA